MGEASEAYNLLDAHLKATGDDTSLLAITKDYLTRYRERHQSISLDALFSEYWESKEHLSKIHRKQILYAKHRFNQLQEVLDDLSAGTQNRYIRLLKSMWAFAVRKGYSKESPAANLDFSHLPKKGTEIFSNEDIKRMLDQAFAKEFELVPYLALGALLDSGLLQER